tara:strand:+ start:71 stop:244 length:174 start_codon:yes stop_codon:yes gene_type:complete
MIHFLARQKKDHLEENHQVQTHGALAAMPARSGDVTCLTFQKNQKDAYAQCIATATC